MKETRPGRTEVSLRLPIEIVDFLNDASDRTGQPKTSIIVDALNWYCGKTGGDENIHLRRASVLAAVKGATSKEVEHAKAALARLAEALASQK